MAPDCGSYAPRRRAVEPELPEDDNRWPEYESERLEVVLARVELHEARFMGDEAYHLVVNHLVRAASAACLLDREPEAERYIHRAASRMAEWVEAARWGRARSEAFSDLAATRGWLAVAAATLLDPGQRFVRVAGTFLRLTVGRPAGSVHNARLAAGLLTQDDAAVASSAPLCDLSDAGLGSPWRKFALALVAGDTTSMATAADRWLYEKLDATQTLDWGPYNEVPIEVSGALSLAALRGNRVVLANNRVLHGLRAAG